MAEKKRANQRAAAGVAAGAKRPEYQLALDDLEALCGNLRRPMDARAGGFIFTVLPRKKKSFRLDRVHRDFLKRGCYVFRTSLTDPERIAVLPTTDPYAVITSMGTSGANWNVTPRDVVSWLRRLAKQSRFVLNVIAEDAVGGKFSTKVRDPEELAWRVLELCPDLENPNEVEKDVRRGNLLLWWT